MLQAVHDAPKLHNDSRPSWEIKVRTEEVYGKRLDVVRHELASTHSESKLELYSKIAGLFDDWEWDDLLDPRQAKRKKVLAEELGASGVSLPPLQTKGEVKEQPQGSANHQEVSPPAEGAQPVVDVVSTMMTVEQKKISSRRTGKTHWSGGHCSKQRKLASRPSCRACSGTFESFLFWVFLNAACATVSP